MFILTITVPLLLYDGSICAGVYYLQKSTDQIVRSKSLEVIRNLGGAYDKRVVGYYRKQLRLPSGAECPDLILNEIFNEDFFHSVYLEDLCERITKKKYDVSSLLPILYRVRSKWWGNDNFSTILLLRLKDTYSDVHGGNLASIHDKKRIERYLKMNTARALCGDLSIIGDLEGALLDKRIARPIVDENGKILLANIIPPVEPYPSRVCDYSILSLLYLGQVDISKITAKYGFRNVKMIDFPKFNTIMFDNIILDYQAIKKELMRLP